MCLIGTTQLHSMQCRGIGPHLVARGMSHGFSRVAAGTWISQDERMSESPVETLEKALGLHFLSKMGLSQLESHVEFTASNFDDA